MILRARGTLVPSKITYFILLVSIACNWHVGGVPDILRLQLLFFWIISIVHNTYATGETSVFSKESGFDGRVSKNDLVNNKLKNIQEISCLFPGHPNESLVYF